MKLIIIGGYGNGTVIAQIVEEINKANKDSWEILGFLNDFEEGPINGYPVIGKINHQEVEKYLLMDDVYFFYSFAAEIYFSFLKEKTKWYKNQWLKYNLMGITVSLFVITSHFEFGQVFSGIGFKGFYSVVEDIIYRKAFFTL